MVIDAPNLFALVRKIDAQLSGFADFCEARAAFAVDGAMVADWSAPLGADSEVLVIPRIAGS